MSIAKARKEVVPQEPNLVHAPKAASVSPSASAVRDQSVALDQDGVRALPDLDRLIEGHTRPKIECAVAVFALAMC